MSSSPPAKSSAAKPSTEETSLAATYAQSTAIAHDKIKQLEHQTKPTTKDASLSATFAHSTAIAQDKIKQCQKFHSFARYLLQRAQYARMMPGQFPSEEDDEDVAALKQQWQDLQQGTLLEGACEVLTESFSGEAKVELEKLNWGLDRSDAAVLARESWKTVVAMIGDCQAVKLELDRIFRDLGMQ